MTTYTRQKQYTFDKNLQLKDAGLVAADAAATVGGSAKIIDLGGSPLSGGVVVIDVSAIEIASNDELYSIVLEGSDSATFASGIEELARMHVGALETLSPDTDVDSTTGRYIMPFMNDRNGRRYRYLRLYTDVAGTIATGINYTAYIAKHKFH